MKFLVLALCVCAASAASFGQYRPYNGQTTTNVGGNPFVASATAQVVGVGSSRFAPPPPAPFVNAEVKQVAVAPVPVAKVAQSDSEAQVISNESEINEDGSFRQSFETNNGISAQSSGVPRKVGDVNALVITGSYRYYNPEGGLVEVSYVADENGYQAKGDSIPVAPPVPEAIARAVQYVLQNAKPEN